MEHIADVALRVMDRMKNNVKWAAVTRKQDGSADIVYLDRFRLKRQTTVRDLKRLDESPEKREARVRAAIEQAGAA
jgi:hypothetical protein